MCQLGLHFLPTPRHVVVPPVLPSKSNSQVCVCIEHPLLLTTSAPLSHSEGCASSFFATSMDRFKKYVTLNYRMKYLRQARMKGA